MAKHIQDAYIVAALRTPVARRRGMFRYVRPDDMLAHVIRGVVAQVPGLDAAEIGEVVTGCANPEAEQGFNVSRVGSLMAGLPVSVPAYTVNRFCSSSLQAVALAADRIRLGEADVVLACGTESMSVMPTLSGKQTIINPNVIGQDNLLAVAYGMGLTAERVATGWKVSRDAQDAFAAASHDKSIAAIAAGKFRDEILPYVVQDQLPGEGGTVRVVERICDTDEGPRAGTTAETLGKLKPVFAVGGSVTAGNSSQMSDGAGAVMLMSEAAIKRYGVTPIARFVSFAVAGVEPEVMGIGPIEAIPRALKLGGVKLDDIDWIELNEAFASQAIAVIDTLGMDSERVNPLGGAIALGHPLGATGVIRTATVMNAMRRGDAKLGMVTMCIGTGMGAAGIFERV